MSTLAHTEVRRQLPEASSFNHGIRDGSQIVRLTRQSLLPTQSSLWLSLSFFADVPSVSVTVWLLFTESLS